MSISVGLSLLLVVALEGVAANPTAGLQPPGSILLPNGVFCPAVFPDGKCPTLKGPPTCDAALFKTMKSQPLVYNIEQAYIPTSYQQICGRGKFTAGSPAGGDLFKAEGSAFLFDTGLQKAITLKTKMEAEDAARPLFIREDVQGIPFPIYFEVALCGSGDGDSSWAVAYNCTEMVIMNHKIPIMNIIVSSTTPTQPDAKKAEIHAAIDALGLNSCLLLPVAQAKECDAMFAN